MESLIIVVRYQYGGHKMMSYHSEEGAIDSMTGDSSVESIYKIDRFGMVSELRIQLDTKNNKLILEEAMK